MSLRDDPKGWARAHIQRIRNDPRGWADERREELRGLVDVAPFTDAALERELGGLRGRVERRAELGPDERQALHDELLDLHHRLSPGGALVNGAKIGLAASVLPVLGLITGPVLGSAYGVYRSQRSSDARDEVQALLRSLVRD
jgi:hypothetical protein